MTTPRSTARIALAASLSLVAVAPAGAAPARAAALPRTARIAVQLEGVQRTTWEARHEASGECDISYAGTGSETYRFRSRTVVLRAIELPGGGAFFTSNGRPALLPLTGTVTRANGLQVTPGKACSSGDGHGVPTPQAPDCGTRSVPNAVEINFGVRVRDRLEISDGEPEPDPFVNCRTGVGEQYPMILGWDGADRRIGRRLPSADLFAYGRNILIARGTKVRTEGEVTSRTTVRWTATLTRVRRPRR